MRQFKIKYETVLNDETPRSENTQTVIGEEQRTCKNSIVTNEATRAKLKGYLAAMCTKAKV